MTTAQKPDVVIRCGHGERGAHGVFVQRFRWMVEQDCWVATRRSRTTTTSLRGNARHDWMQADESLPEASLSSEPRQDRDHYEISCGACHNRIPVRDADVLTDVFELILTAHRKTGAVPAELTITLDELRAALAYRNRLHGGHRA